MRALNQVSVPYRIVLAQLVVGGIVSLGFGAMVQESALDQALAAGLGALIVVIPNGWLAWRVTGSGAPVGRPGRLDDDKQAQESAARILALSITKFLTTAGAAALALAVLEPPMGAFLAGLVATVLTAAVVPPFLAPQQLARTPRLD